MQEDRCGPGPGLQPVLDPSILGTFAANPAAPVMLRILEHCTQTGQPKRTHRRRPFFVVSPDSATTFPHPLLPVRVLLMYVPGERSRIVAWIPAHTGDKAQHRFSDSPTVLTGMWYATANLKTTAEMVTPYFERLCRHGTYDLRALYRGRPAGGARTP